MEEVDPPWQTEGLAELFGAVFSHPHRLAIAFSGTIAGREPTAEDMEPMSWAIYSMVQKMNAVQGLAATAQLQAFTRQLVSFLEPYDALLTPALAERPLPLGTLDTAAPDPMATFTRSGLFTPFTPVFNASGQPAISLPLFQGEDGLPLAVQLVGRPAGEGTLLALAAQLEAARPWAERRPDAGGLSIASPSTAAIALRRDAEALSVGAAAAWRPSTPPSAPPRPRWRARAAPVSGLQEAQAAGDDRSGHVQERPRCRSSARSTCRTISAWLRVCGPASSKRSQRLSGAA